MKLFRHFSRGIGAKTGIVLFFLFFGILLQLALFNFLQFEVPNKLQDFATLSLSVFIEAFPFLILGSLLAAIVNTYIPRSAFNKVLPRNYFFRRLVISLLGFLFPVCECGNVPLSRALMIKGFRPSEAITFLLAAPVLNPVTIWATWAAFSYDESIVFSRIVATLLIANIIGYIISLNRNQKEFLTDSFSNVCKTESENENIDRPSRKNKYKLRSFSKFFTEESYTMLKMLAFGALVAGAIQALVPRDVLINIGSNVVLSIVAMLILAFVISICANVDAFFALSFANTFTAGSIVSFLVFGPMIDIKMLILLKTTFTTRLLVIVSVLAFLFSFLTGLVVTYAF